MFITDEPTATITTDPMVIIPRGENHTIQCTYEGIPAPSITWTLNGNMLSDGVDRVTITTSAGTSSSAIAMVTSDNAGTYTCTASNLLGTSMDSSQLTVQGKALNY